VPRYKLTIEYDGGPFSGWQRQENAPSVQQTLEAAAEALDGAAVLISLALCVAVWALVLLPLL